MCVSPLLVQPDMMATLHLMTSLKWPRRCEKGAWRELSPALLKKCSVPPYPSDAQSMAGRRATSRRPLTTVNMTTVSPSTTDQNHSLHHFSRVPFTSKTKIKFTKKKKKTSWAGQDRILSWSQQGDGRKQAKREQWFVGTLFLFQQTSNCKVHAAGNRRPAGREGRQGSRLWLVASFLKAKDPMLSAIQGIFVSVRAIVHHQLCRLHAHTILPDQSPIATMSRLL